MTAHSDNSQVPPLCYLQSEAHCLEWTRVFTQFLPGLAHRQREVLTRLTGWNTWAEMIAASNEFKFFHFNPDKLTSSERLELLTLQRAILIHEFGVKPAYANHLLWTNPPGADCIFPLVEAHSSALYGGGEAPSEALPALLAELDKQNKDRLLGDAPNLERLLCFTDPAVHIAMIRHLGWDFTIDTDSPVEADIFPVDILGIVHDKELGDVEVYAAGFTSSPEDYRDQPHAALVEWAVQKQSAQEAPLVVLYSAPMVRELKIGPVSVFGLVVADGNAWRLPLSESAKSFSDHMVEVMTADNLVGAYAVDPGLTFAKRYAYCKAVQEDGISDEVARQRKLTVHVQGCGWGKIILE